MKTALNVLTGLFFAFMPLFGSTDVFAQTKPLAELQTELISPYLVTVEGESRMRTLRITGAAQKSDGALLLEATYGWIDNPPGVSPPVVASVNQSSQEIRLVFTSQANSKVTSIRSPDGSFEGTISYRNGETKTIKIQKLSENELQLKVVAVQNARAKTIIIRPVADVPADCAALSGEWTGAWSQGGIGQYWLWVVGVDTNCMAKFAYLSHSRPPVGFATAVIKNGALSFICNSSTGGTCVFKRSGNMLHANYSNPSGGSNYAAFEKIQ